MADQTRELPHQCRMRYNPDSANETAEYLLIPPAGDLLEREAAVAREGARAVGDVTESGR